MVDLAWALDPGIVGMTFAMVVARRPVSYNSGGKARYQEAIRDEARRRMANAMPASGTLYIRIVWFHSIRLTARDDVDVDNMSKPIVDALKDVVFTDDAQLSLRLVQKVDAARAFTFEGNIQPRPEVVTELNDLLGENQAHILYIEVGESSVQRITFGPIDLGVSDGASRGVP